MTSGRNKTCNSKEDWIMNCASMDISGTRSSGAKGQTKSMTLISSNEIKIDINKDYVISRWILNHYLPSDVPASDDPSFVKYVK